MQNVLDLVRWKDSGVVAARIQEGWSWHASHWVTGSAYSLHSPRGKELQITCQTAPSAAVPWSQTVPLSTLTKIALFSLAWVNRNPSQSIRNYLFQILVAGILLSYREQVSDERDDLWCLLLPSVPPSIGHTPAAACWHPASFKYAFISHTRFSTPQTILHYNPASHSPACCCPLQKYLRSQISLCFQVQQHWQ